MRKLLTSIAGLALATAFACSEDSDGADATGGQTSTGGTSGASGTATGGSSGDAGSTTGGSAGSGATSGSSGSDGSGGSSGLGGTGGKGGSTTGGTGQAGGGTDGGEGGAGGAGECAPSSSDGDCARCMLENCCEQWRDCGTDQNCNACGSCLDATSDLGGCVLMLPPLCNFIGDDATARMIQCGCEPDTQGMCLGPCAKACGFT